MSKVHIEKPDLGGICSGCRHDLFARRDGSVYCSNSECRYHKKPHPTKKELNAPKELA